MIDRFDEFFTKMKIKDQTAFDDKSSNQIAFNLTKNDISSAEKPSMALEPRDTFFISAEDSRTMFYKESRIDYGDYVKKMKEKQSGPSTALNPAAPIRGTDPRPAPADGNQRIKPPHSSKFYGSELVADSKFAQQENAHEAGSGFANSRYPRSIKDSSSQGKSKQTYESSHNYNQQMDLPIEDEEDAFEHPDEGWGDFEEEVEKGYSHQNPNSRSYGTTFGAKDQTDRMSKDSKNRFSNEKFGSSFQPSEDVDEVYIDEFEISKARQQLPFRKRPDSNQDSRSFNIPSDKKHTVGSKASGNTEEEEDEEISLSMGTKYPDQILKNKLHRAEPPKNHRYAE